MGPSKERAEQRSSNFKVSFENEQLLQLAYTENHNTEPFDRNYFSCLKIFQQLARECETGGIYAGCICFRDPA